LILWIISNPHYKRVNEIFHIFKKVEKKNDDELLIE